MQRIELPGILRHGYLNLTRQLLSKNEAGYDAKDQLTQGDPFYPQKFRFIDALRELPDPYIEAVLSKQSEGDLSRLELSLQRSLNIGGKSDGQHKHLLEKIAEQRKQRGYQFAAYTSDPEVRGWAVVFLQSKTQEQLSQLGIHEPLNHFQVMRGKLDRNMGKSGLILQHKVTKQAIEFSPLQVVIFAMQNHPDMIDAAIRNDPVSLSRKFEQLNQERQANLNNNNNNVVANNNNNATAFTKTTSAENLQNPLEQSFAELRKQRLAGNYIAALTELPNKHAITKALSTQTDKDLESLVDYFSKSPENAFLAIAEEILASRKKAQNQDKNNQPAEKDTRTPLRKEVDSILSRDPLEKNLVMGKILEAMRPNITDGEIIEILGENLEDVHNLEVPQQGPIYMAPGAGRILSDNDVTTLIDIYKTTTEKENQRSRELGQPEKIKKLKEGDFVDPWKQTVINKENLKKDGRLEQLAKIYNQFQIKLKPPVEAVEKAQAANPNGALQKEAKAENPNGLFARGRNRANAFLNGMKKRLDINNNPRPPSPGKKGL